MFHNYGNTIDGGIYYFRFSGVLYIFEGVYILIPIILIIGVLGLREEKVQASY